MVDEIADGDCGGTAGAESQEEKEEIEFLNGRYRPCSGVFGVTCGLIRLSMGVGVMQKGVYLSYTPDARNVTPANPAAAITAG